MLELVGRLRAKTDVPIVVFGYYNPFFRYGEEALTRDAASAGANGLLCVGLAARRGGLLGHPCTQRAPSIGFSFLRRLATNRE